jgi:Family of unknown function (DUF6152)
MTRKRRPAFTVPCAVAAAFLLVQSARAHHSHGNYVETFTDIEGVVKEVHLVNPHSWIYIEVKGPDGRMLRWSLEASSRNALERIGVTHEYIKAGDTIKVRCHPLRDGSRGCLLGFVKARDGSVKDFDASNVPLPTDF